MAQIGQMAAEKPAHHDVLVSLRHLPNLRNLRLGVVGSSGLAGGPRHALLAWRGLGYCGRRRQSLGYKGKCAVSRLTSPRTCCFAAASSGAASTRSMKPAIVAI